LKILETIRRRGSKDNIKWKIISWREGGSGKGRKKNFNPKKRAQFSLSREDERIIENCPDGSNRGNGFSEVGCKGEGNCRLKEERIPSRSFPPKSAPGAKGSRHSGFKRKGRKKKKEIKWTKNNG